MVYDVYGTQNKHDRTSKNYDNCMIVDECILNHDTFVQRLVELQCNLHHSGCGPLIFEPTRDCCSQFATSRAAWQNFGNEPAGLSTFCTCYLNAILFMSILGLQDLAEAKHACWISGSSH